MPIYDYYCESCGEELTDVYAKVSDIIKCKQCGAILKRATNCHSFKLLYDPKKDIVGWSFNNYERSQYWDQCKKN
jgi:putative FmdB family regulatory protein